MSWYGGTFSCGHEGYIWLVGPAKMRAAMREYRFTDLCPECARKDLLRSRQSQNDRARQRSEALELPPLEGSARQVSWANTLRLSLLERLQSYVSAPSRLPGILSLAEQQEGAAIRMEEGDLPCFFQELLYYLLLTKTRSEFWIDRRYEESREILARAIPEFQAWRQDRKTEQDLKDYIRADSILAPECPRHPGVVVIRSDTQEIRAYYEKDDTFRRLVKSCGYRWDGSCWTRKLADQNASAQDRAAELGNALLRLGFHVSIDDPQTRALALDGTYRREHTRWIRRSAAGSMFYVSCPAGAVNQAVLANLLKIPTASYRYGGVLIEPSHFAELEDFAQTYGYRFDEGANELLCQYRAAVDSAVRVHVTDASPWGEADRLRQILSSAGSILEDLMDDP